jgi:hypothetical protein
MLITQQNTWEPGFRKRTIKKELKIGPVSLKFITIAIIAVGALFYLAESSQGSSQEYQIMQLQKNKQELTDQTKDLEVQAARLKSLNEINTSSQSMGLVANQSN